MLQSGCELGRNSSRGEKGWGRALPSALTGAWHPGSTCCENRVLLILPLLRRNTMCKHISPLACSLSLQRVAGFPEKPLLHQHTEEGSSQARSESASGSAGRARSAAGAPCQGPWLEAALPSSSASLQRQQLWQKGLIYLRCRGGGEPKESFPLEDSCDREKDTSSSNQ